MVVWTGALMTSGNRNRLCEKGKSLEFLFGYVLSLVLIAGKRSYF